MSVRKGIPLWGASVLVLIIAAFSVPAIGRGSKMTSAPPNERLFDHKRHNDTVKVKCDRCHKAKDDGTWKEQGKTEHARCFSCHKFSSNCGTLARKEGRVCLTCHTTFKTSCTPSDYTPPEAGISDYNAKYSHKLHIRPRAKTGEQCETCHGAFGETESPQKASLDEGHALCAGCHAKGVSPRIKESCDGCHISVIAEKGPKLTRPANPFAVSGTFDHKAHAGIGRVGTEGRDCLACHSNIKTSSDAYVVPLPTMDGCRSACHDGDKAFDAVGTSCTRCHTSGGK